MSIIFRVKSILIRSKVIINIVVVSLRITAIRVCNEQLYHYLGIGEFFIIIKLAYFPFFPVHLTPNTFAICSMT